MLSLIEGTRFLDVDGLFYPLTQVFSTDSMETKPGDIILHKGEFLEAVRETSRSCVGCYLQDTGASFCDTSYCNPTHLIYRKLK